ncbi:hypothetical protein JJC03_09765 [Flavobacterium oreochromis]|nr:hypothetical protein [Flavobacterium oreochromis]QYS85508.1 hypothetical protein JJC03_09765 [Flavobacterium oreochromis]
MKKDDNNVEDTVRYWSDFEGELSVYYHFIWETFDSQTELLSFISNYIKISEKYKIAVPINGLSSLDIQSITLYPLYQIGSNYYYPTYLFVNTKDDIAQKIISIDPLIAIENSFDKLNSHGSIPVRIEFF